jgi:hypothetical protein
MGMVLLMRRSRGMRVGVMRMLCRVVMKTRMMGVLLGGIGINGLDGWEMTLMRNMTYDGGICLKARLED